MMYLIVRVKIKLKRFENVRHLNSKWKCLNFKLAAATAGQTIWVRTNYIVRCGSLNKQHSPTSKALFWWARIDFNRIHLISSNFKQFHLASAWIVHWKQKNLFNFPYSIYIMRLKWLLKKQILSYIITMGCYL